LSNKKLLSIVIPSYNSEKYIDDCLSSIINQESIDTEKLEVIFVDDGSTDKTSDLIKKYTDIPYIQFYYKTNSGISLTRNFGVQQSTGKYILFLDSDDKLDPYGLSKIMSIIDNSQIDILFFSGSVFYESNVGDAFQPTYRRSNTLCERILSGKEFFVNSVEQGSFFVQPCMFAFNRNLFINNEFIPGILHEDNPFTLNLLLHRNNSIYCIQNQIYQRRVRSNSVMTSSSTERNAEGYLYSIRYIFDNYYVNNQDKILKKAIRIFLFKLTKCGMEIAIKINSPTYYAEFEKFYRALSPSLLEDIRFKRPLYYKIIEKIFNIKKIF